MIDLIVDDLISCTPVYPVIVTFVYIELFTVLLTLTDERYKQLGV